MKKSKSTGKKEEKSSGEKWGWRIAPLIISISALVATIVNNKNLNYKWDQLNLGNIVVRSVIIDTAMILPENEFNKIGWGYQPWAMVSKEGIIGERKISILSNIKIWDSVSRHLDKVLSFSTNTEAMEYLQKVKADTFRYKVRKAILISIGIENMGATETTIINQRLELNTDGAYRLVGSGSDTIQMIRGIPIYPKFYMHLPIASPFIIPFTLRYTVKYIDVNRKVKGKRFNLIYKGNVGWEIKQEKQ